MTYTLTRILSMLKMLDKQISDKTRGTTFVDLKQKKANTTLFLKKPENVAASQIKADYESLNKLISNRTALKSALVKANAETRVSINGKSYSIAEAIEEKTTIANLKNLLNFLQQQKLMLVQQQTTIDEKTEATINALLTTNLSSAKNTEKYTAETIAAIATPLREENKVIVIDPIGIDKEIETLSARIDGFTSEVDFVLSEINAKTSVEVEL